MVYDTKLYDLLGVSPDVNERDLRVAYRKKAREYHPDVNKDPDATDKFQQINEAYDILKDPQKRQIYDKFGIDGLKGRVDKKQKRQRTSDIIHKINVKLEDLYNGKEVSLQINRDIICPDCRGAGCKDGKQPPKCPDCDGSGKKIEDQRLGFMIKREISTCPTCQGLGEIINPNDRCPKCKGQKVVEEKKKITVHIEPGMEDNDHITFSGCSDEAPNAETGNLIVVLCLKKHPNFIRKHDNLLIVRKVSLSDALLMSKFTFKHLDGRKIVVTPDPKHMIVPNSVKIVKREGMPLRGNTFEKGDLYIFFDIVFPTPSQLTPEFKKALKSCIPPCEESNKNDSDDENDDEAFQVTTEESNIQQFEDSKSTFQPHDEDDNTKEDSKDDSSSDGCNIM